MTSLFIEDIGTSLDDNDGSAFVYKLKNADLTQGKDFLNYERGVTVKTLDYLPFLELTSMPGLTSINEAFTGDDSLRAKNTVAMQSVSENENAFNKTLSDYSTLQKSFDAAKMNGYTNNDMVRQLAEFKNKLVEYAKKINNDISSLQVDDESLKGYILEKQANLNNYIQKLNSEEMPSTNDNIQGKHKQSKNKQSKHHYYLMWVILLITFLFLFMYILTSRLVMNTLVVIICLMTIYILARAINKNTLYF